MINVQGLNENQKNAVLAEEPYLRIVAGAGSGKTRVLTMRIAHLIEDEGVFANRILAITFTNKAANEMKERIRNMLPGEASQPWISTIHSLCVRILREDIQCMGWPRNFTVMDPDDQKTILKEAYKEFEVDQQTFSYASLLDYISNNKTAEISTERAYELAGSFTGDKTKAQIYEFYVNRQQALYALDFDDLILWVVKMFRKYSEVLDKWQRRFNYIHVDEFQDIDQVQYNLIRMLAGVNNNLYVVGDPDQTIYTWRGADVNIIMNFEKDFPGCKTIMLNENYRSTNAILNGANSVIKNNRNRLDKALFTNRKGDAKITHYSGPSDEYQAAWVASKIRELHSKGKEYRDIAILYRSNYLSRSLEKAMVAERIPYIIYGGVRFYERQEVKDALCYLRMVSGADDLALQRILNRPKRGIGNKTMDAIYNEAHSTGRTMYEVLRDEKLFTGKTQNTLDSFVAMIERWKKIEAEGNTELFELFERIIAESGLKKMLEDDQENDRLENLKELIDDVREFSNENPESTLDEYLQGVTLLSDREETMSGDYIQMMTVHASKGLEFDTVFVTDMNEGIFPSERAITESRRGIEEERRLAYVAFTRARNKLFLTDAGGYSYILQRVRTPSRFINEIDPEYLEHMGVVVRGGIQEEHKVNTALFAGQDSTFRNRMEQSKPAQKAAIYKKGEQVVHAKFGEGVVVSMKDGFVTIAFAYPHGVKKLMAGHPSIQKKSDLKS